jgi:large repetitive protein
MDLRTARRITVVTAVLAALVAWPGQAAAYTEGQGPVLLRSADAIDYPLSLIAPDWVLTAAHVRIRGGAENGERLRFTRQLGFTPGGYVTVVSGTYNSGTGVLTLRGRASGADYQRALASVWYEHNGDRPSRSRIIEIRARDARGRGSRQVLRRLAITPVNDAPRLGITSFGGTRVIAPGTAVLDPDSRISGATVQITENFSPEQDELTFTTPRNSVVSGTYDSGTGILTLTGTARASVYQAVLRSVAYRNRSGNAAQRTITFQVTDAQGASSNIFKAERNPDGSYTY